MTKELVLAETFYPTVMVDPDSEYYKSLKPYRRYTLKCRVKRGPGKGRVNGVLYDSIFSRNLVKVGKVL